MGVNISISVYAGQFAKHLVAQENGSKLIATQAFVRDLNQAERKYVVKFILG